MTKVNDLIQEDLTEEQKKLLEIDEKKKKHKLLKDYLKTEDYKKLIEYFKNKSELKLEEIKKELDNRRKGWISKATQSELNISLSFYDFQLELANKLWNSEAEEILKTDLINNADNTYTHLTNKVEELYDVPSYSNLDLIKKERMEYWLIDDRIEQMVWFYDLDKQKIPNLNPYEEDTEENKALTDVS